MLLRERRDCWCLLGGWRLRREPDHELLGWQFAWCQFGFRGGQWSGVVAGGVGIGALCRHTDHARFGAWGASCATLVLALVTVWFTAQGSGPIITSESFGTVRMLHGEDQSTIGQPCVILLDLNLPRMNGIKFPEELRRDAKLKDSVVFVLTTLNSDDDRVVTNSKYVAGCLLKSEADADFGQLFRCVQPVLRFSDN
jgi:CheY-like chemotaxis protein